MAIKALSYIGVNSDKFEDWSDYTQKSLGMQQVDRGKDILSLRMDDQKQRLTIARAMLKSPSILILDEATSSLDSESEKKIQNAIDKLMHGKTSLIIAHKFSTIKKCDKIILIDKGRIIAQGTHQELINSNSSYKNMNELQI